MLKTTRRVCDVEVKSKEVFLESPGRGTLVWGNSFYTRRDGVEKMRTRMLETRSDTIDSYEYSYSPDNGRTWDEWRSESVATETPDGMHRRIPAPGFVDPQTDRLITIVLEGVLPSDDPLEGRSNYYLSYRVSTDGGRTNAIDERLVQRGRPQGCPFEPVRIGKNCIMTGGGPYFRRRKGFARMLFPIQMTVLGPDGEYYNPGGGYTWTEAAVLVGTWGENLRIDWRLSERVALDPSQSTRGAIEPTVAEMPDGRMLMVVRASNDEKPEMPCYKWCAISVNGGLHWGAPAPWTCDDGSHFYSPSSISQLIRHSGGRVFWVGNITAENPKGNLPRYPLVIGEVDQKSLKLRRPVVVIDDLQPNEDPSLQLSNFALHEDRETGEIVLHLSRFITQDWHGDAFVYRIEV